MLHLLDPLDELSPFPPVDQALRDPDGLLAVGGDLSPARILRAYSQGIFPWYSAGEPILWWSPDPRAVLFPSALKISKSLAKTLRNKAFRVSYDEAFSEVIGACGAARKNSEGTWITPAMRNAYTHLHQQGNAHSLECWQEDKLVGGLYGIAIGQVFFGESMFNLERDASKVALVHLTHFLQEWGYSLIDCQVHSDHLSRLGAIDMPRGEFMEHLARLCKQMPKPKAWHTTV